MSDPCPTCGHNPDTEVFTGPVTINAATSDAMRRAFRRALTHLPADKTPLQMHAEADGLEVQARMLRARADRLDRDQ